MRTTRTWERIGSATGAAGILLALAGVAGRGSPTARPGWDATIEQIVAFASRPVSSELGWSTVMAADGVNSAGLPRHAPNRALLRFGTVRPRVQSPGPRPISRFRSVLAAVLMRRSR
jgi:hypothetical protein